MSKGRRAADRRREREGGRIEGDELDVDPSDHTQLGPGEVTVRGAPLPADSLTRAAGLLDEEQGGEITTVRDDPPKPRPPGLRLVAVDGSATIDVVSTPFLLGRAKDCDAVLDHPSVSRRHAQLVRFEDGGFILEDLSSSSGCAVNGAMAKAPVAITHGDFVQLGPVELRARFWDQAPEVKDVVVPGGTVVSQTALATHVTQSKLAPPPKPASSTTKRGVLAAAIAAALVVVGIAVGVGVGLAGRDDAVHVGAEIDAMLAEAKKLFDARRLKEAKDRVDAVFALDPANAAAKSLLRMIESELEAKAALDEATARFDKGELEEAKAELQKIADSSLWRRERDALLAKISRAENRALFDAIAALIDAGQYDEALARIETMLERFPDDANLLALKTRAEKLRGRKPVEPEGLKRARQAFAVNNREQAAIIADAEASRGVAMARAFKDDLAAFEQAYAKGKRALADKDAGPAVRELERAYTLARKLTGSASGLARREVGAALADALYLAGVADEAGGRTCAGAERLLRAAALDPEDPKIAEKKRALERRALAGLERAKAKVATSPALAKEIASETLCLAAPGSAVASELKGIAGGR